MLLGVVERFRANCRGFWGRYWWCVVIFSVGLLCDGLSTIYFMLRTGPEAELHAVIRFASQVLGPVGGPLLGVLGKGVCGVVVAIYLRRFAIYIFFLASFLSFWAAWYNMWGHEYYVPLFMKWLLF